MMQGRRSELRAREDQIKDILSGHYIAISFQWKNMAPSDQLPFSELLPTTTLLPLFTKQIFYTKK